MVSQTLESMESLVGSGSGSAAVGFTVRRKRSCMSHRPRVVSDTLHNFTFPPPSMQPTGSLSSEETRNSRDKMVSLDGIGNENKLKLKLKLGGVTHTIHTKPTADVLGGGSAITKYSHYFDVPQSRERILCQDDKGSNLSYLLDKGKGSGVRLRDSSRTSSRGKTSGESISMNERYTSEPVRKSKRVPKRRVLDVGFNGGDDDEDEEIRYLGRLNTSNVTTDHEDEEDEVNKREQTTYEDKDYMEEEEPTSDDEPGSKRKKLEKGSVDSLVEGAYDSIPTTRNRALQSGKDVLSGSGASILEFPNGLPPAPPKKQKEKLSEVEQQLKKAEAAQRRRMQSEKAAREAEAEAIRKILGQDSNRKKKEEKLRKQQDEWAQGKAAKSDTLASNTVRWVIGPTGTTVTFSEDIGLPNIFNSAPRCYPPPREKCAGPNCTNPYRYRDSKSKLPLCSLNCYKAIQGKRQPLLAC